MLCALIAYAIGGVFISVLYYPHLAYIVAMTFTARQLIETAARRLAARGSTKSTTASARVQAEPEPSEPHAAEPVSGSLASLLGPRKS